MGGTAPTILNAANEIAVDAFLNRKIGFVDIPVLIESVLSRMKSKAAETLEIVIEADQQARQLAKNWMLER
jgi:1-deoxy-D-xylulose-5-phosphate reductoisomerase